MDVIAAERFDAGSEAADPMQATAPTPHPRVGALFPDPLGEDDAADEIVVTTRRAIGRVALVATETAGRFQREAVAHDPMAWMFAPRLIFEGGSAIDACLGRSACLRAILVHALSLGLNVERSAVDALMASDGDGDESEEQEFRHIYGDRFARRDEAKRGRSSPRRASRIRMYTATILDTRDNLMRQVFHASLARDAAEVRTRLAGRFGPDIADLADIRLGIHSASPPVVALVPVAVIELIQRMERDCAEPGARTFAVDIEVGIQA